MLFALTAVENVPAAQSRQAESAVDPVALLYVPAPHAWHVLVPVPVL